MPSLVAMDIRTKVTTNKNVTSVYVNTTFIPISANINGRMVVRKPIFINRRLSS